MKLTRTQQRKLKAAGWTSFDNGLFWRDPISGNYFSPPMAWLTLVRRTA